jgi:large subunit ribosomal protein L6
MSRIGEAPITIPAKVTVEVSPSNVVKVKGPKRRTVSGSSQDISIEVEGDTLTVERHTEQKRHKALHGTYRALISNMVKGVSEGCTSVLELVGVGYRATVTGQVLK